MEMPWRFLDTGAGEGAMNMALDEALWRGCQLGTSPPTVRVYAWETPTLSIGHGQRVSRDIDLAALERLKIPLVRRPTGGRAVLHDRELTYSIVLRDEVGEGLRGAWREEKTQDISPLTLQKGSILADYALISRGLLLCLQRLGVPAKVSPPEVRPGRQVGKGACFLSASAYEVVVPEGDSGQGKKIIGSAQRRGGGALLQHGSLLLDLDIETLSLLFKTRAPESRARLAQDLSQKTASLREALGREVSYPEAALALKGGFEEALRIALVPGPLTEGEERLARDLLIERYQRPEWTFRV
jgi:lipoate-protein ligase A